MGYNIALVSGRYADYYGPAGLNYYRNNYYSSPFSDKISPDLYLLGDISVYGIDYNTYNG